MTEAALVPFIFGLIIGFLIALAAVELART
jgi:hypothetical protein